MNLGDWWNALRARDDSKLKALMRPELGATPEPLRRVLAPVIAVAAIAALIVLAATGALAMGVLFMAMGLAYLLLTYVFGLRLELTPR